MKNIRLQSLSGDFTFDENHDPLTKTGIQQFQDGQRRVIAWYGNADKPSERFQWSKYIKVQWKGGSPPSDVIVVRNKKMFVTRYVYGAFCTLASIGIALALGLLIMNVHYRKNKFIKMSSPNINNIILVGCIVMYITIFLQDLHSNTVEAFCKIRSVCMASGVAMVFGALFAKTWRIYKIFANKEMKKVTIKDRSLIAMVGVFLVVNLLVLVVWEIADPRVATTTLVAEEENYKGDILINYFVDRCTSTYSIYFVGIIYAIEGLLFLFGAFLAAETRKVKIAALNDSQQIGVCVYNVMVLSSMAVIMSFVLQDRLQLNYSLTSAFIFVGTTTTQCLIFIPKIAKLRQLTISPDAEGDTKPAST